jgi:predicted DNA-binding antitoxin AbrB/MazE fold protein
MKIKGIKRGKNIELSQKLDIPDGTEVVIEISDHQIMSEEQRREKLKQFLAIPSEDREELVAVLTELENERNEKIRSELNIL